MILMVYVWLAVVAAALIAEASTATLVAIWFIPSAILSAAMAKLGVGVTWQVVTFFILSILLIVFARKLLSKYIVKKPTPTNADALIGRVGVVVEDIDNLAFRGIVKASGQTWSAKSHDGTVIPKSSEVEILEIQGVKLVVKEK